MASASLSIIALLGVLLAFCVIRVFVGGRRGLGTLVLFLLGGGMVVALLLARGAPSHIRITPVSIAVESGITRVQGPDRRSISVSAASPQRRKRNATARFDPQPPEAPAPPEPIATQWDDPASWGRIARRLVERVSQKYVDDHWTSIRPVALSFSDQIVVIGRGEVEVRRGHDKHDLKRSWKSAREHARESASEELADLLSSPRVTADPALRDIARQLRSKNRRGREKIASGILGHAVEETGPQIPPAGKGRPILRQSVRYEIGREQFLAALLDELGAAGPRYERRRDRDRSESNSGIRTLISIVVVWLLVIGASAVLRAGARGRLAN